MVGTLKVVLEVFVELYVEFGSEAHDSPFLSLGLILRFPVPLYVLTLLDSCSVTVFVESGDVLWLLEVGSEDSTSVLA